MTEHPGYTPEQKIHSNEPLLMTQKDLTTWQDAVGPMLDNAREAEAEFDDKYNEAATNYRRLQDEQDERRMLARQEKLTALDTLDDELKAISQQLYNASSQDEHDKLSAQYTEQKQKIANLEAQLHQPKVEENLRNDPSVAYLDVSLDDLARERRRREEQIERARHNEIRLFADETDLSPYEKFLQPGGPPLGEEFSFPKTDIHPHMDTKQARARIEELPFVPYAQLRKTHTPKSPHIEIVGSLPFPAERIISQSVTMTEWVGREHKPPEVGNYEDAYKQAYPDGVPHSDIGTVIAYASHEVPVVVEELRIIRDAAGEYWAYNAGGGCHRMATGKLRGVQTVTANRIRIDSEDEMPTLSFSVREKFSKNSDLA